MSAGIALPVRFKVRVLLIDDESLLDYKATVLRDAAMDVETLVNPLKGLKELARLGVACAVK